MNLVTGAAGHLGTNLVRELVRRGEKVRVFVLPDEDISSLNGIPLEVVKGNVVDKDSLRPALQGIDTVYHLAGIISIMPGRDDKMRQVNVVGTSNVARLARESHVRRMVYVSSIHAIARPPKGTPIDESIPFDPHNAAGEYDQTKAEASLAVLSEVAQGLDAVIICPTGIIGPHYYRGGSPMLGMIRKWMKPGWHLTLNGQFDFVDVRDVARGMILAAEKGRRGETYIIRGERASVGQLISLVREETGNRGVSIRVPFRLALLAASLVTLHSRLWKTRVGFTRYALETIVSNCLISGAKSLNELGYQPRPMRETIRDTVRWLAETPEQPAAPAPARRAPARATHASPSSRRLPIAVVTGASSGIGAIVARRLAGRGFRVFLVARREEKLASLADVIRAAGGQAEILPVDLSRPEGVRAVYERVMENGEGIDVLVNNAGFGWYGYASDMPSDTARQMIQVNNEALAQLIVLFLPLMRARGRGHVINVSSIVGGFPSPWAALYSATKSFIDTLSTALHRELRGTGVHVSAVRPGPVVTDFYQTVTKLSAGRSIPVGRSSIQPEAVADAIVGLLQRPRRAVYVPGKFRILPWVELGFGWLIDRVAGLLLRRQGSHA
ncbi:MAG: SDR family NAD(P)-dependent oxidoreductase [Spirochaetia bacterium]|jgi:dihydroflavonol-4-reductase